MADETTTPETVTETPAPVPTATAEAAAKGDFAAFTTARERGAAADTPAPEKDAPVEKPAPEGPAAGEPAEPADGGDGKAPSDPAASEAGAKLAKRKGSLQERINELTHDRYATARERDAAVAEVNRLRQELTTIARTAPAKPVEVDPAALPKPKVADFETYEDFSEALADWKAAARVAAVEKKFEDRFAAEEAARRDAANGRAQHDVAVQHQGRVDTFRKDHTDFDTVMEAVDNADFVVPPLMREHILRSDLGPALLYHLAKHQDDFRRISGLTQGPMLVQLGRLEARLDVAPSGPTPAAKPVSSAPPPIKPVGSSATATSVSTTELAVQGRGREFMDRRDREERERKFRQRA